MSKVITFSTVFPSYHPRKGEPTLFVEKIWASLVDQQIALPEFWGGWMQLNGNYDFDAANFDDLAPKRHTIRAGNRWKAGDKFSPRIWSGRPYNSPQLQIAPDMEVKKVWNIGVRVRGDFKEFYCDDCDLTHTSIALVAKNDGLEINDLFNWFPKPFTGQIICWDASVDYNS